MPEEILVEEMVSEKEQSKSKAPKKAKTFLNKVVIRKLPPNLTSDDFLDIISPVPEFNDFYFVKADWSLGAEATSRAYIEFKNQEDIFIFKEKFDEYVFVDHVRGTEYPAIVEFAPFQNVPKKKARKDKHVNTIENEQHFLNFLEMLQKEDYENQKPEPKLEYSYQIKDDKKITSTPLLEFIAAAKEEKREAKKKKIEDKKKAREEEKQRKKIQIAKNIPEPIKETKEEIIYEDGIMVRTVPSRLGRNDKSARKESKNESKDNKDKEKAIPDKDKERREKRDKEREEKKKIQREKEEKKKQERAREREAQKTSKNNSDKKIDYAGPSTANDETQSKNSQPKKEIKRYSELRKARQERTIDSKETDVTLKTSEKDEQPASGSLLSTAAQDVSIKDEETLLKVEDDDPRWKRIRELREKREQKKEEFKNEKKLKNEKSTVNESRDDEVAEKREDERAQRQIRNKDRPALQIYRPKKVLVESKPETSIKSSDENSESHRKRDKKSSRRSSRDESNRKKKTSRKNSSNSNGDEEIVKPKLTNSEEKLQVNIDDVTENLQQIKLDASETNIQNDEKVAEERELKE